MQHGPNPAIHDMVRNPLSTAPLAPEGSSLVLVEWTDPGGGFSPPRTIAPRHIHHDDDEAFYILEGMLAFELDGEIVRASAGDAVMIVRGTCHTWWNPKDAPCRYLILMPRRIHELINAIHTSDRESVTMNDLFKQYGSEVVDQ